MFSDYLKENYDWETTTREIEAMTARIRPYVH